LVQHPSPPSTVTDLSCFVNSPGPVQSRDLGCDDCVQGGRKAGRGAWADERLIFPRSSEIMWLTGSHEHRNFL